MDGLRLRKKLNHISLLSQTRDVFTFLQRSERSERAVVTLLLTRFPGSEAIKAMLFIKIVAVWRYKNLFSLVYSGTPI